MRSALAKCDHECSKNYERNCAVFDAVNTAKNAVLTDQRHIRALTSTPEYRPQPQQSPGGLNCLVWNHISTSPFTSGMELAKE